MALQNPSHTTHSFLAGRTLVLLVAVLLLAGTAQTAIAKPVRIVAFGDSLVAGYGLSLKDALPEQLTAALKPNHPDLEILNAGVSGDTTAAALARLDWAFPPDVDGAIVLLGGNDFLRGLSPHRMKQNLDTILTKLKARNLEILILGMKAPRNTGKAYYKPFDAAFPELAEKHDALLDPFYLEGVATRREYNQIDGLHPNAKGVAKIVNRILPKVEALIERIHGGRSSGASN